MEEDVKVLNLGDRVRIIIPTYMQQFLGEYKYIEFTLNGFGYNMQDEFLKMEMKDSFVALIMERK